jgi:hypothetical protein
MYLTQVFLLINTLIRVLMFYNVINNINQDSLETKLIFLAMTECILIIIIFAEKNQYCLMSYISGIIMLVFSYVMYTYYNNKISDIMKIFLCLDTMVVINDLDNIKT